MDVDVFGLGEGDVLDEQPDHALAVPLRGRGVGPQRREVHGQRTDAVLAVLAEGRGSVGGLPVVVVLGVADGAQRIVPVRSRLSATSRLSGSTAR